MTERQALEQAYNEADDALESDDDNEDEIDAILNGKHEGVCPWQYSVVCVRLTSASADDDEDVTEDDGYDAYLEKQVVCVLLDMQALQLTDPA